MKAFSIICLTPKGELTLLVQNKKRSELKWVERQGLRMLFTLEHLQNPSGLRFVVNRNAVKIFSAINPMALVSEIEAAFLEEGAIKGVDFRVELEE